MKRHVIIHPDGHNGYLVELHDNCSHEAFHSRSFPTLHDAICYISCWIYFGKVKFGAKGPKAGSSGPSGSCSTEGGGK